MKVKALIRKFFNKEACEVESFMQINPDEQSEEDIHNLRLSVKKIRALLSVAKLAGKEKRLVQNQEPLKRLFSAAGKVRDIQLRAEKIIQKKSNAHLPQYNQFLHAQISNEKKKLVNVQQRLSGKIKKSLHKLKKDVTKVRKKDVKKFNKVISKKKRNILNVKDTSTPALHGLRKQIKKQHYLSKALGDKTKARDAQKKVLDILGKWHDCRVMAEAINTDLKKADLPKAEVILLKKITLEQLSEARGLEKVIREEQALTDKLN